MHAIPEKLAALRQSMEGTMTRQLMDQRLKLEQYITDNCKETENVAVQRAEDSLKPQITAMDDRWQVKMQQVQQRLEETFPKITEVSDLLTATRSEIQPLHARADAAAARFDRLAVQTATITKDVADLGEDMRDAVAKLRRTLDEERQQRVELGEQLKALLTESSQKAHAEIQSTGAKADTKAQELADGVKAMEERLQSTMGEQAERSRREQKLGDEDTITKLRNEIQALEEMLEVKVAACTTEAEALVKKSAETLQNELDASSKRVVAIGEQGVEKKARELITQMNEGLEAAKSTSEEVRSQADSALTTAVEGLRKTITDTSARFAAEDEKLQKQVTDAEARCVEAANEAERKSVEVAARRIEVATSEIKEDMHKLLQQLSDADNEIRKDTANQLQEACLKLERNIGDMGNSCNATAKSALAQAVTDLQAAVAEASKKAAEATEAVRSDTTAALKSEADFRKQDMMAADEQRNALARDLRDELKGATEKAAADTKAHAGEVSRRFDQTQDSLKTIQRSLEASVKEHGDNHAKVTSQLKTERQRTEEVDVEHAKIMAEARDTLDALIRSEVAAVQSQVAECRKKIHEESTTLRSEMRELPSKKEVLEVSSVSTERHHDLSTTLEQHKARLEVAIADFASRCREVRGEASEARLRMQKETMALGTEITQLRGASTSLTNGVIKALQVLGLLQSEAGKTAEGEKEILKALEVEDLLEWEKVGKSLASRIARQWYEKEAMGIANVLTMVERKADNEDLARLRLTVSERTKMNESAVSWASTCATASSPNAGTGSTDKVNAPTGAAPPASPLKGRRSTCG